jgi:hypothetical protein
MRLLQHQERCTLKSSTHNPSNIQSLRSDKRFDALVKQQMIEHQHIISSHHKEMQTLRNSLSLAMEKIESLSKHGQQELNDFKESATNHVSLIKNRMIAIDANISDQKKTIQDLHKQLNEFHDVYASKTAIEKFKKDLGREIETNTMSNINSFQQLERDLKSLFHSMKDDWTKLTYEMKEKFAQLAKNDEINFSILRMDKDSILKEIRTYEKTIFIIEKKIENIYTLIERINKTGEVCHKPE